MMLLLTSVTGRWKHVVVVFVVVVDSVIGGWDHVVEGLFTAGLLFMEHFAPKSSGKVSFWP